MNHRWHKALRQLAREQLPQILHFDEATRHQHAADKWFARRLPEAVALPRNTAQVSRLLRFAHERGIPVTARGAGYGYVGGCVPVQGGLVLSLARLDRIKESGSGISSGRYIYSDPHSRTSLTLWGLPVVSSFAISESQFLVGAFKMAAQIWDRQDATVEISREHASFFIQNMVAILCEERLALTVYRPAALIYGGFPYGS